MMLMPPFADIQLLAATYRLSGIVPAPGPAAYLLPRLLALLKEFITKSC
jgi:hypothetical protein